MASEPQDTAPIRRGRGLRLSTEKLAEEPSTIPPSIEQPLTRGRGLRLSTTTADAAATPPPVEPPPSRRRKTRPATATATDGAAASTSPAEQPSQPTLRLATEAPVVPRSVPATATAPSVSFLLESLWLSSGKVAYRRAGAGPALLLIHGFGATSRIWRGVAGALADARTSYALDLPGSGGTPPRPAPPTLRTLADATIAFADGLGLGRFDLCGHGLGAAVAAMVAARYPDRVGRVVLSNLGARSFAPELMALEWTRAPLDLSLGLARPFFDFWQPWNRYLFQAPPLAAFLGAQTLQRPPADQELWRDYLADHAATDGRSYLTALTAAGVPHLHAALRAISAPTLLVAGDSDRLVRLAEVEQCQRLVADSRLVVLEDCGHLPMIEVPDLYHQTVRDFLG
ncbi:MAG: alpha/beta hydrolase [Chloroflexaceae bacterium]|nr:alpha/beta hydrolase [Chloroflexaceae bacterium]